MFYFVTITIFRAFSCFPTHLTSIISLCPILQFNYSLYFFAFPHLRAIWSVYHKSLCFHGHEGFWECAGWIHTQLGQHSTAVCGIAFFLLLSLPTNSKRRNVPMHYMPTTRTYEPEVKLCMWWVEGERRDTGIEGISSVLRRGMDCGNYKGGFVPACLGRGWKRNDKVEPALFWWGLLDHFFLRMSY